MKKSDLKTGMRVKLRNDDVYLVLKDIENLNHGHQDIAFVNKSAFISGDRYADYLKHNRAYIFDIVEVFTITNNQSSLLQANTLNLDMKHSVWKRTEEKEMTMEEIEQALGYKVKIVQSK